MTAQAMTAIMDESISAYWGAYAWAAGGRHHTQPGLWLFETTIPLLLFNTVILTTTDPDAIAAGLAFGADCAGRTGGPVLWRVTANAATEDVRTRLARAGLSSSGPNPAMAADLGDLPDSPDIAGLTIETADGADARRDWAALAADGFELPAQVRPAMADCEAAIPPSLFTDQPRYVARIDAERVATSSLVMTGDTAGIYAVATRPGWRKRGIGTAVTLHAMREGQRRGAARAVLQASDLGRPVYEAIGFRHVFDYALFAQSGPLRA